MGQIRFPSKSWVFTSRFAFIVRQNGQLQLSNNYATTMLNFCKILGAPSFSRFCLCIKTPQQKSLPLLQSIFISLYLPLLVYKIVLTNPTNTPFLYTSAIFYLPISYTKKYFPCLSHLANSGWFKRSRN